MYSQSMPWRTSTPREQQNVIVRIIRLKPASYWHVWFIYAPLMASGPILGGLLAALTYGPRLTADRFLLSLPMAGTFFLFFGASESYRLDRRRHTVTYSK
jgi:hypothetical protein